MGNDVWKVKNLQVFYETKKDLKILESLLEKLSADIITKEQYEKILVDLFDQFAAESIEEALDKNEGSFGENIQSIVQCALDCLKGKVMQELGVSSDAGGEAGGAVGAIMGGMGLGGMSLQDGMGSMDSENSSEEDEEGESDEHEDSES